MANAAVSRKLWALTTTETFTSYMNWQENLIYVLGLDNRFTEFMEDGFEWEDGESDNHGFEDDEEEEEAADANAQEGGNNAGHANAANNAQHPRNAPRPRTAAQKVRALHLMLGQIANYCNVIARHQILYESTSLDSIWEMIRVVACSLTNHHPPAIDVLPPGNHLTWRVSIIITPRSYVSILARSPIW